MTELKACPFCGGIAQLLTGVVGCHKCGAEGPRFIDGKTTAYDTYKTVEAWNTRSDTAEREAFEAGFKAGSSYAYAQGYTDMNAPSSRESYDDYKAKKAEGK